jgi:hypothetical protein
MYWADDALLEHLSALSLQLILGVLVGLNRDRRHVELQIDSMVVEVRWRKPGGDSEDVVKILQ